MQKHLEVFFLPTFYSQLLGKGLLKTLRLASLCGHPVIKELTEILGELWELIDVLTSIFTARDAEPKFKIKALKQLIPEVVPLNHAEVINGFVSYCELHPEKEED